MKPLFILFGILMTWQSTFAQISSPENGAFELAGGDTYDSIYLMYSNTQTVTVMGQRFRDITHGVPDNLPQYTYSDLTGGQLAFKSNGTGTKVGLNGGSPKTANLTKGQQALKSAQDRVQRVLGRMNAYVIIKTCNSAAIYDIKNTIIPELQAARNETSSGENYMKWYNIETNYTKDFSEINSIISSLKSEVSLGLAGAQTYLGPCGG